MPTVWPWTLKWLLQNFHHGNIIFLRENKVLCYPEPVEKHVLSFTVIKFLNWHCIERNEWLITNRIVIFFIIALLWKLIFMTTLFTIFDNIFSYFRNNFCHKSWMTPVFLFKLWKLQQIFQVILFSWQKLRIYFIKKLTLWRTKSGNSRWKIFVSRKNEVIFTA